MKISKKHIRAVQNLNRHCAEYLANLPVDEFNTLAEVTHHEDEFALILMGESMQFHISDIEAGENIDCAVTGKYATKH